MEPAGDPECCKRQEYTQREEESTQVGLRQGQREQNQQATDDITDPRGTDVQQQLGGSLVMLGDRRKKQLISSPGDGAANHYLHAPSQQDGQKAGNEEGTCRSGRDRPGKQRGGAGNAQTTEQPPKGSDLDDDSNERRRGVERGEEAKQRFAVIGLDGRSQLEHVVQDSFRR